MKILYYSSTFGARHGGSNHSKHFVKYASKAPDVEEIEIFPPVRQLNVTVVKESGFKKLARRFSFFLIPRFYARNRHYFEELCVRIEDFQPDVLVMRPDNNFLQIPRLKQRFPKLLIATELNASSFDESYVDIPFKKFFKRIERNAYAQADANFLVSDLLIETVFADRYDANREFVVYNGVEPEKYINPNTPRIFQAKLGIPEGKLVLGYLGTLDKHKKVEVLIKRIY